MSEHPGPSGVRVERVDDAGLHLTATEDLPVDVLFDGRRIWSFWTRRDAVDGVVSWPQQLRRFLDGRSRVAVVEHTSGRTAYDDEVALGGGTGRIAVVDEEGRPLGLDKSNRLVITFDTRDPALVTPLLDATEKLLAELKDLGVEAFPAYGTLLGAVREHDFIGHDSDVDLGYVSRRHHPVDVMRESFRLQRELRLRGYDVDRYSGAAFKVDVREPDGSIRGLDVFGGFFLDRRLYLMGEVGTPFEEDWIFPLGTCTLAGRTLPAPARPEKLLEAMYGPGWRVPDPAFHFETPLSTRRRLNGWFRGMRVFRNQWDARYSGGVKERVPTAGPSALARFVRSQEPSVELVVDVGGGRASDALWFSRRGVPVVTLDFAHGSANGALRAAETEGLLLDASWVNLHELRSVLAQGARLSRSEGRIALMANHLVDHTDAAGVAALVRLARMVLSGGGRLYLEFDVLDPGETYVPSGVRDIYRPKRIRDVEGALRRGGADIVLSSQSGSGDEPGGSGRAQARVVAEWQR